MSRGKSKQKPFNNTIEFVRVELSNEDKEHFKKWSVHKDTDIDSLLAGVLENNYKVSFSYTDASQSFICSITGKPEDCDNASKCMTSHAKDPVTALRVALYKHVIVMKSGIWESFDDTGDFG